MTTSETELLADAIYLVQGNMLKVDGLSEQATDEGDTRQAKRLDDIVEALDTAYRKLMTLRQLLQGRCS